MATEPVPNGDLIRTVELLERIVITGNGELPLKEKVRNLEREMQTMNLTQTTILERLGEIKENSDIQRGREEEKKTQIEAREKKDGRRATVMNILIGLFALAIAFMTYKNETNKREIKEQLQQSTQQIQNTVPAAAAKEVQKNSNPQ